MKIERKYTIRHYKLMKEVMGNDAEHNYNYFIIDNVKVYGQRMDVYFCKNEKGIYAVAGKRRTGRPSRGMGFRYTSTEYLDVYYRINFRNADEGNAFYKKVKTNMYI